MAELPPRWLWTVAAHAGRALLAPLDGTSVETLLSRVPLAPAHGRRPAVLDIGCGKGEVLVRAMLRLGATGTGVDPNPAFVADARARATQLGREGDLTLVPSTWAAAKLPAAAYDLVVCCGAAHACGGEDAALAAMAKAARPDGCGFFACGYWRQPPARGYLAATGMREDEMRPLAATLAAPAAAGWKVVAHHPSSRAEWDDYEHGYAAAMRRWLEAHPAHVDAPAFRERIDAWAAAYERWGRDALGFVAMVLARA